MVGDYLIALGHKARTAGQPRASRCRLDAETAWQGLILFAHGARDPGWAEPFEALATRVRALAPATPVRLAFLELMQPDLGAASADLISGGADTIRIVPIFFGQGGHLRRDLPERVDALQAK